jgi:hypothetical protein
MGRTVKCGSLLGFLIFITRAGEALIVIGEIAPGRPDVG